LSNLVLSSTIRNSITDIIAIESTRELLVSKYGVIGINKYDSNTRATIVTFAGDYGTGKKTVLYAIGYELQRSVQLININVLINGNNANNSNNGNNDNLIFSTEILLKDAKLGNNNIIYCTCLIILS
jgi:predicted ATPase